MRRSPKLKEANNRHHDSTEHTFVSTKEFVFTAIVCCLAYGLSVWFDATDVAMSFAESHEAWEIDELFPLVVVLGVSFGVFAVRRWRELRIEMTARKEADARTRASEQRFATAFGASPQPTVIAELARECIVDANTTSGNSSSISHAS